MLRVFLTIILPLLLPTLVWIAYMAVERRRLAAAGAPSPSWLAAAPWPWLVAAGLLLMLATLAVVTGVGSGDPGEVYKPAHVGADGKLVPGQTVPADKP